MTRILRTIALALGLVSTAALADSTSVFSCMVSPTEKIDVGLDNGVLTYYYQDFKNDANNRFLPGEPDNKRVSIYRGMSDGFNGEKNETFNITFHTPNSPMRIVVSMDITLPNEPHQAGVGQVIALHSGKRVNTWNCRDGLPQPDALRNALNNHQVSDYTVDATDATRMGF